MLSLMKSTLTRFILVGILNTVLGSAIMFILYNAAHCSYWISSSANYIIGSILSFFLNKYFTFNSSKWDNNQVVRFIICILLSYLIAYGIAKPIIISFISDTYPQKIIGNLSLLFGMILFTCINYIGQKFFVFKKV